MASVAFPEDERIRSLLHEAEQSAGVAIRLELKADSDNLGEYELDTHTVRVFRGLAENTKLFAIAHELAHAIWRERGYPRLVLADWFCQGRPKYSISCDRFAILVWRINNLVQDSYADNRARRIGLMTEDVYDSVCGPLLQVPHSPDWRFDGSRFRERLERLERAVRYEDLGLIPADLLQDLNATINATKYATILLRCASHHTFPDYRKAFDESQPGACQLGTQLAHLAQTYAVEEPQESGAALMAVASHVQLPQALIVAPDSHDARD